MIFGRTKLELKVGIFVFFGLIILTIFVLLIGDFKTWSSGYKANFIFNFVNGIKVGAPVRFAGVDVGEVKAMDFILTPEDKTQVQVVSWLNKAIRIPADSTVWVNTLGLFGEKYIEIIPGKDYKNLLAEKETVVGQDPIPMHEVGVLAKSVVSHLDESIVRLTNKEGTLGRLLYDDSLYKEVEAAIKNKEGTIGQFFYNDSLYKEIEALVADLRAHPWKLFWKTKEKPQK